MNIIIEGTREEAERQLRRVGKMLDGNLMYVGLKSREEDRVTYLVQWVEKDHPMPWVIKKFVPSGECRSEDQNKSESESSESIDTPVMTPGT